jgi:hypothetical protein
MTCVMRDGASDRVRRYIRKMWGMDKFLNIYTSSMDDRKIVESKASHFSKDFLTMSERLQDVFGDK